MEYRMLGRTGLRVSVMGLGAGGQSRIGLSSGLSTSDQVSIVRQAIDAGVNFVDTSEVYQTEAVIGEAIKGIDRDSIVVSTKKWTRGARLTAENVTEALDASLDRLGLDYVDIYHLHAVDLADYEYLLEEIVPVLHRLRERGKLRFVGITELGGDHRRHQVLQRALRDDVWDAMMVNFNIINQSAREQVLVKAIEKGIGILVMFAVRRALSQPTRLQEIIDELVKSGELDLDDIESDDALGFLMREGGAFSHADAGYRFCRDEPGTHIILSGTGNPDHLRENIESFARPPLPVATIDKLKHVFRRVESTSGQ